MRFLSIVALVLSTSCAMSIAERSPKPSVNVQGKGGLQFALSQKVPDTVTLDGPIRNLSITHVHKTLTNGFNHGFADVADSNGEYTLELQSFDLTREDLGKLGSTAAIRYKANLRDSHTGEVLLSTSGTAFPKNPMANDGERIYDDAHETMFEKIAAELFPLGMIVQAKRPVEENRLMTAEPVAPAPEAVEIAPTKKPKAKTAKKH